MKSVLFLFCVFSPQEGQDRQFSSLIEKLRSSEVDEREKAARDLLSLGERARPALTKALRDKDGEVSVRARRVLELLDLYRGLTPGLRRSFPGIEARLAGGNNHTVTAIFLEAGGTASVRKHPDLSGRDVRGIVLPATRGTANFEEKRKIIRIVERWDLGVAWPIMAEWTHDPEPIVRREAARALVGLHSEKAVPVLIPLLRDENQTVREAAVKALAAFGGKGIAQRLAELLADDSITVRKRVVDALCLLDDPEANPRILSFLENEDSLVRDDAIRCVGRLGIKEAIPVLSKLAGTKDDSIAALEALSRLGATDRVIALLGHENSDIRQNALIRIRDDETREAVPAVIPLLDHEDVYTVASAVKFMGQLRVEEARPRLLALAKHSSEKVRTRALWALSYLGERSIIPGLLRDLRGDVEPRKLLAARILWSLRVKDAVPDFLAMLEDEDPRLRRFAIRILDDFPGKKIDRALEAKLEESDRYAQLFAIEALGRRGQKEASAKIEPYLKDELHAWVAGAIEALSFMGRKDLAPRFIKLMSEESVGVLDVVAALRRMDARESVPDLIALLRNDDPEIRWKSIMCLDGLGDERATPEVAKRLGDPSVGLVRRHAARYLARRGDPRAASLILEHPEDLTLMNAYRAPETWKRLSGQMVSETLSGPPLAIIRQVAEVAGLSVSGEAILQDTIFGMSTRSHARPRPEDRDTLLGALLTAIGGSVAEVSFILEKDEIRLVSRQRAVVFWRNWWGDEGK